MTSKESRSTKHSRIVRQSAAMLSIAALLASMFAVGISAQSMKSPATRSSAKLSEDQRVLHVLNRLGFGARPGDVERVKAMGVDNYILSQLEPDKIDDPPPEAPLQNLETCRTTRASLYAKYHHPRPLLQHLRH